MFDKDRDGEISSEELAKVDFASIFCNFVRLSELFLSFSWISIYKLRLQVMRMHGFDGNPEDVSHLIR